MQQLLLCNADEENKSIPHEFPRSHSLKVTGQCVKEYYLSVTMRRDEKNLIVVIFLGIHYKIMNILREPVYFN